MRFRNKIVLASFAVVIFFSALVFFKGENSFPFLHTAYSKVIDDRNFEFEYVGEDEFFEYYFLDMRPEHHNSVRWALKNKGDGALWVETLKVKYYCRDRFIDTKVHYFGKTFMPGEKSASIGSDSVCKNYNGFHKWKVIETDWQINNTG